MAQRKAKTSASARPVLLPGPILAALRERTCPECGYFLRFSLEIRVRWDWIAKRLHAWLQCRECGFDLTALGFRLGVLTDFVVWRPRSAGRASVKVSFYDGRISYTKE